MAIENMGGTGPEKRAGTGACPYEDHDWDWVELGSDNIVGQPPVIARFQPPVVAQCQCGRDVDMTHGSDDRHRRSIRLQGYDYAQGGAYFITICTQNRQCLFCGIVCVGATPRGCTGASGQEGGHMHARDNGQTHADPKGWQPRGGVAPTGNAGWLSLGDVVHRFKTMTTKRYTDGVKRSGWRPFEGRLWQRNY
jgi:putative transposase